MSTSSIDVSNPVNQIAELLSNGEVEKKDSKVETPIEEEQVEILEDESQPHPEAQSLEDEGVEEETLESAPQDDTDVDTLNNLAETLEVEISDLYALNVNMSEGDPMTLGSLKDFYESNHDLESVQAEVQQKKDELQSEYDALKKQPVISNELLQARAQVMSIQDQFNRVNWDALRQQDPGQYAALQSDFRQQFDIAKDNEGKASQVAETHMAEARMHQQKRLFEAVPELKDDAKRQEIGIAVNSLANKYGFTADDVANIEDHRLMKLLIDASRMDVASGTARQKQVDKTPVKTTPTAQKQSVSTRKAALKRLTEKAKQTGETRDRVNAVAALLNN